MTLQEDCFLTLSELRNCRQSSTDLQTRFAGQYGRQLSTQTIQNRVHVANLWSQRVAKRPAAAALDRRAHLRWCQHHAHWNLNSWRNMFSDQSRLCLLQLDQHVDYCIAFGSSIVMVMSLEKQGLLSLEATSMLNDIKIRICSFGKPNISTVWDQTLSSKLCMVLPGLLRHLFVK